MIRTLRSLEGKIATTIRELGANGRGRILLGVSVGWLLSIGVRFMYPALVPYFRAGFGIDFATTGLLLTVLWAAYAVGHVPGGVLGDRWGEGTILVVSTAVSALAILVVATAGNVWALFAGTIGFGLATALYGPTRFTILTDVYPNRAGAAIGLTLAAGNIGNAVFPPLATVVATSLSWRFSFAAFVPLFLGATLALWLVVPNRTSGTSSAVDEFSIDTLRRVRTETIRTPIPTIVSIQIAVSFLIQGFGSFYPAYLTTAKRLSPAFAALLFGLFFAIGAVLQPLSGSMMDRVGKRDTLVLFFGGCTSALWLLPFLAGRSQLLLVTILVSTLNGCAVVTQTFIADALPQEMQGTGLGTLKAGWMLCGAAAPLLIGVLADSDHFDTAFVLLAVVASVGWLLSFFRL